MGNTFSSQTSAMPAASKAATELVKQLVAKNRVMVFAKSYCPYCHRAEAALKERNIKFEAMDLDTRKEGDGNAIQESLLALTGQRTVPNIFANGHHVGGCSETLDALANGKFVELLEGNPGKFAAEKPKNAAKKESDEIPADETPTPIREARM
ncbi:Glutaredoxin [Coemansia sp. RSA 990]|nr:glutaredoxin [Coemansia mojavensis]KAJ1741422.1 Glutaredoxin [Coemansia sp. RSA 1086]KAJ1871659.1 Glutaredoxin [Coemansia sp. RSA 990]